MIGNESFLTFENKYREPRKLEGVKSLVQIQFASRGMTLTYFNDLFDLRKGDIVYVDGKLAGEQGVVIDISYSFKIKLSQYHKVIALVNTEVHGDFYIAGSHLVTFGRDALPKSQAITWFKAPICDNEEYVVGDGYDAFDLNDLTQFEIDAEIAARGEKYYLDERVRYISIDGTNGYAIVQGSDAHEVEFTYIDGQISRLFCDCYCSYNCKHELAVLLQLRKILSVIDKKYAEEYSKSGYFAAISKKTLLKYSFSAKSEGIITL